MFIVQFVLYFLWLKIGRTQSFFHTAAVFVLVIIYSDFDRQASALQTVTFLEHFLTPFIGMITGPIDTILNIILFVRWDFLPLLYKKHHHMKTVALTGFLFSLAVEIVRCWGSSDINDLMTNTAGACIGLVCHKSCLQSEKATSISNVYAVAEVLLFIALPLWSRLERFVHDVLNVPPLYQVIGLQIKIVSV